MGQKINPFGFRLGTTQSHDSIWFAQPTNYSENIQEEGRVKIKNLKNLSSVHKASPSLHKASYALI